MNKTLISLLAALSTATQAKTFGATEKLWQERSMYRNIIVLEGNNHRCLTFGLKSSRQSCMEISNPTKLVFGYTQRIFEAIEKKPNFNRILMIGIGGGSLPMAIREKYPDAQIDAVELDQKVIDVAVRFFHFKPDEKLSIFAEDGRVFIRKKIRENKRYDIVILDAFDKEYVPEHMSTMEFLQQVKQIMETDGILLSNTFGGTSFAQHEEATYQHVFGPIYESQVPNGNRIIIVGQVAARIAAKLSHSQKIPHSNAQPMSDKFAPANILITQ